MDKKNLESERSAGERPAFDIEVKGDKQPVRKETPTGVNPHFGEAEAGYLAQDNAGGTTTTSTGTTSTTGTGKTGSSGGGGQRQT